MIQKLLLLLFFSFFIVAFSQTKELSNNAEISIITYGPGDELFEKFGHSAIRVKDSDTKLDLIYNYGIFDFDAPNFYLKFIRGFMNYKLASYKFHYAVRSTNKQKRWMKEQILNLTPEENNAFYAYLENNAKPENASYFYDPYFNNCATKPRDILKTVLKDKIVFAQDTISNDLSFRELMNKEIHWNTWGNLGINIALGSKLDKATTTETAMYLPDYVFKAFKASKIKDGDSLKPLIKETKTLLNYKEKETERGFLTPLLITTLLMLLGLFITYIDNKKDKRSKWLDFTLFFTTGIFGTLIIFLWFFTNHSTAPNNFNFLWAFAPNIYVAFKLVQKNPPKWILKYLMFLLILLAILLLLWILKVQLFSICLIPIFILLGIRYWFLQKTLNC